MAQLIKLNVDGSEVWIEADDAPSIPKSPQQVSVGSSVKKAVESIDADKIASTMTAYCKTLVRAFRTLPDDTIPNSISAEFGIKVNTEGTVYVVKAAGEASLKVTAEWKGKG